jgi:hypothetical protein
MIFGIKTPSAKIEKTLAEQRASLAALETEAEKIREAFQSAVAAGSSTTAALEKLAANRIKQTATAEMIGTIESELAAALEREAAEMKRQGWKDFEKRLPSLLAGYRKAATAAFDSAEELMKAVEAAQAAEVALYDAQAAAGDERQHIPARINLTALLAGRVERSTYEKELAGMLEGMEKYSRRLIRTGTAEQP